MTPNSVFVSAKHKMLVAPATQELRGLFPRAPLLRPNGEDRIVIPHGVTETRLLRNMGFDTPAPILSQYDWCGGKPFSVQKKTAAMLTTNPRAYVLNGLGTGKTKTALWAFDYLKSIGAVKRALVVAPLSTLSFVWKREVFGTIPHRSAVVLHGDRAKRLAKLDEKHDVYIVNPDGVGIIMEALEKRPDIDVLIIDELAIFRSGNAVRSKNLKKVADRMEWVWGMTGSPTPTCPTDAWGQARIVTPNTVDKRFGPFRDRVLVRLSQFRFMPKKEAADVVTAALTPAVRYSLDDVVELPDVVTRTVDTGMGTNQKRVYETLRKEALAMIGRHEISAVNAGAVLMKLLQVSLGYVYTKPDKDNARQVVALDNEPRIDALLDILSGCERKVLVFVPFTHALNAVAKRLSDEGYDTAVVDGSTTQRARGEIFVAFQQTSKYRVLVAHPGTMAHGVTLTAADTIIWFGPTTSYETFEQANGRITRIGQKHKQQVIMMQATAAERKIYATLRDRKKVQDTILDMFAEATT